MGMFDQATQPMGPNGYMYNGIQPQAATKFNNVLTQDQIKMLMQNSEQFSLRITEEELLRAVCNHRNLEGTGDALVYDPVTGEATCTICGYKFRPIEPDVTPQEIVNDVLRLQDILQTIKLMYIDLPPESSKEFFPIIGLLDKVPKLFEYAVKNMTRHESYNWQYNGRNMGAINMFNNLQNMFGSMSMMGGMPQQPNMGQPVMGAMPGMGMPQAPNMMPQQPGVGFGYPGASAAPTMNPAFNMMAQMGGQQPQFTFGQPATPPQAPAAPATPEAPAAPVADTTVTQTVNA